jgi:uncharacterized protein
MKRLLKGLLGLVVLLLLAGSVEIGRRTRAEAHRLLTNPMETRKLPRERPIDFGLVYDDVSVRTSDGLALAGWYVPPENGALVILQHGYKSSRGEMLNEAALLHQHGYGALIPSIRAHDMSEGDLITFGKNEMQDLDAWYRLIETEREVDPGKVGILGNSMGGSLAIQFAVRQPAIRAVVTNAAFSSLNDTIETSVRYFSNLPPFPFAPLIAFWAEREAGFRTAEIDAKQWIRQLSPRPVLLMQGGADVVISKTSGQLLYDAAGEPKELWYDPEVTHAHFDTERPAEYERRVVAFFDTYLLGR